MRRLTLPERAARVLAAIKARPRLSWGDKRNRGHPDAVAGECDAEFLMLGCSIVKLDAVGDDVPDRVLGCAGRTVFVEYKTARKEATPGQQAFARLWRGGAVYLVKTREEARALANGLRVHGATSAAGSIVELRKASAGG